MKFKTKNWVEVNDGSHKKYSPGGEIKFKTMMLRLGLWDCNDAYILVKGTITIAGPGADAAGRKYSNKK